ncbi:hypothetical protein ACWIUD_01210 [Helicobacter sp. 23-1044]
MVASLRSQNEVSLVNPTDCFALLTQGLAMTGEWIRLLCANLRFALQ